jgi:catalase
MNTIKVTQTLLAMALLTFTASSIEAQAPGQPASPAELVDALHSAFGTHPSRAVHAKGIILEGTFTPAPAAAELTKAPHLQKERSKVIVRFSDFTGIPDIPDNIGLANPRGLAIKFIMPDDLTTDIVGHSFDGFPTPDSDQFRELLLVIGRSGSTASKPTALDSFLEAHPVAKTFLTTQKNPASYAGISYFGVNAFKFTNKKGVSHFIRYQFIPIDGEELLTAGQMAEKGPEYLQEEIKKRIAVKPVKFSLYAQIAEEGDNIEDPSTAWPASRKRILLGVIEITSLSPNTIQEDKSLFFIPNNIPAGIETADPMLNFRSNAYPISVKERQ